MQNINDMKFIIHKLLERANLDKVYFNQMLDNLKIKKNHIILDAGCGPGKSTEFIYEKSQNQNIVGIDFDEELVDFARKHTSKHIDYYLEDLNKLSFNNCSFDICIVKMVLDISKNYKTILDELIRVTKTDGMIAIYSNLCTTVSGYPIPKNTSLIKRANKRMLRYSGHSEFPWNIVSYLKEKGINEIYIDHIIKDTIKDGWSNLNAFYSLSESEIELLENNILVKLNLISAEEIKKYENDLNRIFDKKKGYLFFTQIQIIFRVKNRGSNEKL